MSKLSKFKKPSSHITSEDLEKIFKQSELARTHFFPKEVPSLSVQEIGVEDHSTDFKQKDRVCGKK